MSPIKAPETAIRTSEGPTSALFALSAAMMPSGCPVPDLLRSGEHETTKAHQVDTEFVLGNERVVKGSALIASHYYESLVALF